MFHVRERLVAMLTRKQAAPRGVRLSYGVFGTALEGRDEDEAIPEGTGGYQGRIGGTVVTFYARAEKGKTVYCLATHCAYTGSAIGHTTMMPGSASTGVAPALDSAFAALRAPVAPPAGMGGFQQVGAAPPVPAVAATLVSEGGLAVVELDASMTFAMVTFVED